MIVLNELFCAGVNTILLLNHKESCDWILPTTVPSSAIHMFHRCSTVLISRPTIRSIPSLLEEPSKWSATSGDSGSGTCEQRSWQSKSLDLFPVSYEYVSRFNCFIGIGGNAEHERRQHLGLREVVLSILSIDKTPCLSSHPVVLRCLKVDQESTETFWWISAVSMVMPTWCSAIFCANLSDCFCWCGFYLMISILFSNFIHAKIKDIKTSTSTERRGISCESRVWLSASLAHRFRSPSFTIFSAP